MNFFHRARVSRLTVPIRYSIWKGQQIRKYARGNCLEIGSAGGLYKQDFHCERISIDIVPYRKDPHVVADVQFLPFQDRIFYSVVAFDVLEHVTDPFQMLSEIHRVLVDKGTLILTTPKKWSVSSWWELSHRWHFSNTDLRQLLSTAGFVGSIEDAPFPSTHMNTRPIIVRLLKSSGHTESFFVVAMRRLS